MNMHAARQSLVYAATNPEGHTWLEWHHALGHGSVPSLQKMHKGNLVEGMKVIPSPMNFICKGCIQGKHQIKPVPQKSKTKYKEIGKLVTMDLWGPAPIKG